MTYPDGGRVVAGRYRLLREIGRGGMGVVWEGYDTLLDRPVAIKEVLLPPNLPPDERERQLARTSREARTAARLNHRGIVAVYDVAEEDGRPWIVMELVRARGLDQAGTLPVHQAAGIGRQVLSALRAAHEAGILHRDVKPSNILLADDGRAVLTDFGIATLEGDASLTQTGMVTGSPSFLPPERATAGPSGPWSDLWSLGATLYAALLGQGPFERPTAIATLGALITEEPDFSRVPPEMREVLTGLLQRDPAHRLTAEQADLLLAEASGAAPAGPRRDATGPRRADRHRTAETPAFSGAPGVTGSTGTTGTSRSSRSTGSHAPARERWHAGRIALIAAAVAVLGGGGAAALAMSGNGEPDPSAAPPVTQTATVGPAGTGTPGDTATPSASPSPSPTPTKPRKPAQQLRLWQAKAPDNWTIRYPAGWRGDWAAETNYTQWLSPDGQAHLGVEVLPENAGNLDSLQETVRDDTAQWSEILTEKTANIPLAYGSGLDWTFTWKTDQIGGAPWAKPGVTYRETRRFVGVGDTVFVLSWTAAEGWNGRPGLMEKIFASFHPRGGE
ncbi:serine/threonine-protein kinase [Streptosporangium sp. NPDC004379]|uniref:serine/threonine-protein kinase n=1 Tax=Streptosporangium sp. NPDC004379 TaxID=3366189 RepID=UPI0036B6AC52